MFFVAKENGSVLLSCRAIMELGLIKPRTCLDYLPPKAKLLTSTCDQPSKTKIYKPTIQCTNESAKPSKQIAPQKDTISHPQLHPNMTQTNDQLVTQKEHIMARFPDVFEGVGKFPGEPYKIQLNSKSSSQAETLQTCSDTPKAGLQSLNR